jgi:hypothetical protein
MRNFSLVSFCGLLLVVAACSSDSSDPGDPGGGEIRSQDDVRRLFEAMVPDLVEAFTEVANQQFAAVSALSTSTNKAEGDSSVSCPGGTLVVNVNTGLATLTNCVAGGVTISASLTLNVFPSGPSSYQASFWGTLTVSGSFNGTVEVEDAYIEWTDPATVANTLWQVTVTANGQTFTVAGGGTGSNQIPGCSDLGPASGPASVPRGGACDQDTDCQEGSCRDPERNPEEGCTCGHTGGGSNTGDCDQCIGVNTGPTNAPNPATQCEPGPDLSACTCLTQNGETVTVYLSGAGCIY